MWRTAITCGILAFVSATTTLWLLGTLFPPAKEVAPIEADLPISLSNHDRYGRVPPRRAEIGPGSRSSRATQGQQAAPPRGPAAQPKASIHAVQEARSLFGDTALRAGLRLIPTSLRAAVDSVGRGDFPLSIVAQQPSPRQRRLPISVESLGHFVPTLAVHPDNPLRNLDLLQTRELLAGRVENWSELGGPDAPIRLLLPTSKTRRSTYASTLIQGDALGQGIASSDDPRARLRAVANDRHAVTFAPLPSVQDLGLPALRIADQAPGIGAGYQFKKEFFLITGPTGRTTEARRTRELLLGSASPLHSSLIRH